MENSIPKTTEMASVIRRLKKVMALSNSNNPGEAAAALHQAEVMMKRYGLSQSDIALSDITESPLDLETAQISKSDAHILAIIKVALGVQCILSGNKKTKGIKRPPMKVIFVGEAHRIEIAQYAFVNLRRQLKKSIKKTLDELLQSAGAPKSKLKVTARIRDAYAFQWCASVYDKVHKLAPTPSPLIAEYVDKRMNVTSSYQQAELPKNTSPLMKYMAIKGSEDGKLVRINSGVNSDESPSHLVLK